MTIKEAKKIVSNFEELQKPTEEEIFVFTEAMNFLIEKKHRPEDMMHLGGFYYQWKQYDLALKYYEMAKDLDYEGAYECLGYIWYYGRTGTRDFKKAFEYFSILMDKGDLTATYKIADMYKNGYYVGRNPIKYKELIESLYDKVKNAQYTGMPLPEVFTRLAKIRSQEGNKQEAIELYLKAKDFLAQRIKYNAFFGNLNIMEWLIDDLYKLIDFDKDYFDFYDLYYLLKTPNKIEFRYQDKVFNLYSEQNGDECNVCFNGKWFRNRTNFFREAMVDNMKVTTIYQEFYGFELMD